MKARTLKDNRRIAEVLTLCTKSQAQSEALARRILASVRQMPTGKPQSGGVRTGILLTNDLVIRLVQGSVAEADIVGLIASRPSNFILGANELSTLKQAGVPDTILTAMQNKR